MSFALTQEQLLDGSKTVTRRLGWRMLRRGDVVQAIDKHNYREKGACVVLGVCTVRSIRREPLNAITDEDVRREGFPAMTAAQFVTFFSQNMKCGPDIYVTRIEFTFQKAEGA
jgi:hypothetical protein